MFFGGFFSAPWAEAAALPPVPGMRPAAQCLSFACPKERHQRKRHPSGAGRPRADFSALLGEGGKFANSPSAQTCKLLFPPSPALLDGSHGARTPRSLRSHPNAFAGCERSERLLNGPHGSRRAAQGGPEKEAHMFEACKAEFVGFPARPSSAEKFALGEPAPLGCPFLWCLSFGQAKERHCAAGRTSRHRRQSRRFGPKGRKNTPNKTEEVTTAPQSPP